MAAASIARPFSPIFQLPSSPPASPTPDSLLFFQRPNSPVPASPRSPAFRRTNTSSSQNISILRSTSIARSCSAGSPSPGDMVFTGLSIKKKPKHPRPRTPDSSTQGRPSGRAVLKTKRSLASLLSSTPDTAKQGSLPSDSPVSDDSLGTVLNVSHEEEDEEEEEERNNWWIRRHGMKLHPYPQDAPYMQAYEPVLSDNEHYTYLLLRALNPTGSPSFHDYGSKPPASALDLGCGQGDWVLHAATAWARTQITAFDLVDVTHQILSKKKNVHFRQGNFLKHKLPFPDDSFDFIRMANLVLCIPFDKWEFVVSEAKRVLAPDGRLEMIDDQIFFPYADAPPEPRAVTTAPTHNPPPVPLDYFDVSDSEGSACSIADVKEEEEEEEDTHPGDEPFCDNASTLVGESDDSSICSDKKRDSLEVEKQSDAEVQVVEISVTSNYMMILEEEVKTPTATSALVDPATPTVMSAKDVMAPTTPTESLTPLPIAPAPTAPSSPRIPAPRRAPPPPPPPTPAHPTWTQKSTASRDLEVVYEEMLSNKFGIHPRPSEFLVEALGGVFGLGNVRKVDSLHLKLAPADEVVRRAMGRGHGQGFFGRWEGGSAGGKKEKEKDKDGGAKKDKENGLFKKEKEPGVKKKDSVKKEKNKGTVGFKEDSATVPSAITHSLSVDVLKANENARSESGLATPESANPASATSSERPKAAALNPSNWVAPAEWDVPMPSPGLGGPSSSEVSDTKTSTPRTSGESERTAAASLKSTSTDETSPRSSGESARMEGSPVPSPRSSEDKPRPLPAPPTKSILGDRPRPAASIAKAAGRLGLTPSAAAAEAASITFPPSSNGTRVQSPGLILWPNRFIPMSPTELEMHACKNMHVLLGCKPALAEYVASFVDEDGTRFVEDEEFHESIWEYECFRRQRFNWPSLVPETSLDMPEENGAPIPVSAVRSQRPTYDLIVDGSRHPYSRDELTHVRTFRVYEAVKPKPTPPNAI